MSEAILEVRGISKSFSTKSNSIFKKEDRIVVSNLDFKLASGSAVAIVGESGCGKTTTARLIMGLEKPLSGQIFWKGTELSFPRDVASRKDRAKKMQMVFQNPFSSLTPTLSIDKALEEIVKFHQQEEDLNPKEYVQSLLDQVGLSKKEGERLPKQLSGGQCQRAAIARALAAKPELIILDEAVSALDVSTQAQILNLIESLRVSFGISLLFITHDLAVVRQTCDSVIVMNNGALVETGMTSEILSNPINPYTRKLLGAVPRGMKSES
jgi:ABC-type glutathione transport system ATPase component